MVLLCPLAVLDEHSSFGVSVAGNQYLILANSGQPTAYKNLCPHLSIPLEWSEHQFLDVDSGLIRCSTHGALFLPESGLCVSGPCYGESLQAVSITIQDGQIFLQE